MEDIVVVLDKSDMAVTLDGKSIKIRQPDAKTESIPLGLIGQVVVYGNPMVSCDVWRALNEREISAVLFPSRGKELPAWMGYGLKTTVMVRKMQHLASEHSDIITETIRWVLDRKLLAQSALIRNISNMVMENDGLTLLKSPLTQKTFTEKAENGLRIISQSRQGVLTASNRDALMGHEGIAAAAWFQFLSDLLPDNWAFKGRNRRPALDPINALLSLTYTLAGSEMHRVTHMRGLDPCIGFLHTVYPGRESLVLDLMEPLRPCAEAFIFDLLFNRVLSPSQFTTNKQEGCRLNKDGRGFYYMHWAEWRNDWAWSILTADAQNDLHSTDEFEFSENRSLKNCCQWIIKNVIQIWKTKLNTDG